MKMNSNWIDKKFERMYSGSKKSGLHIVMKKVAKTNDVLIIRDYIKFLRKKYFFPIKCTVFLTNDKKYKSKSRGFNHGVFFPGSDNPKRYPRIFLPIIKETDKQSVGIKLFDLTCLISYYYQWYFYADERYSKKTLETEANNMAFYLVEQYLKEYLGDLNGV